MKHRVGRIQEKLQAKGIDAIVIGSPENRRYLSGFTGTSGIVLITLTEGLLLTDFRYVEQAKEQAPHLKVVRHGQELLEEMAQIFKELNISTVAIEEEYVTYEQYVKYRDELGVTLEPVKGWVEDLRLIKDQDEVDKLKQAVKLADDAFNHIIKYLEIGKDETEISLELEFYMRRNGASGVAFDTIIASGQRGALPHGVASKKKLQKGDLVVMDYGAVFQGYHSDMTRTVAMAEINDKQKEIYNIVLEAQQTAVDAIKPGMTGIEVDAAARKVIAEKGYADYFGHGLGHGVGLAVHEGPRLSPNANVELQPGMAITVEPGIYLPEWGGVRIEDIILVTDTGCRVLTQSTKELLVL